MDTTDRKLIATLRRDSRMPISDLAAVLGVARATARARIEKLLAAGDIQAFTILTREDVSHSPVRGLMMLNIEGAGTERIVHRLTGFPAVSTVHSTNGKWDLIVEIGTESLEEFDKILYEIRRLEGVTSSETNLLLSSRKSTRAR